MHSLGNPVVSNRWEGVCLIIVLEFRLTHIYFCNFDSTGYCTEVVGWIFGVVENFDVLPSPTLADLFAPRVLIRLCLT